MPLLYAMLMFKLMPTLNTRAKKNTSKNKNHSLLTEGLALFIYKLINLLNL